MKMAGATSVALASGCFNPSSESIGKNMSMSRRQLLKMSAVACLFSAGAWSAYLRIKQEKKSTQPLPSVNEVTALLCSSKNAVGDGLLGEYFDQCNFTGKNIITRTDGIIDSAALNDRRQAKSVRWKGWVKASMSGAHRFHFDHPAAKIIVSKNDFSVNKNKPGDAIDLKAGVFYPIDLELPDIDSATHASIKLEWTPPHGYRYPISSAMLFVPVA